MLTHFWVDNLDMNIDRQCGGGALNITTLVAFQEGHQEENLVNVSVPRKKTRRVSMEDEITEKTTMNLQKSPPLVMFEPQLFECDNKYLSSLFYLWLYLRKQNAFDQLVSSFSGFLTQIRSSKNHKLTKTVETYLPPFNSKVTEFSTIRKYFVFLHGLSKSTNMPYVVITLDVGAALNAYKVIWNYPEKYEHVFLQLGSFHFMKENFQVIILYSTVHFLNKNQSYQAHLIFLN